MRTSSSHEEGGRRDWSVMTKSIASKDGKVTGINAVRLTWETAEDGRHQDREQEGAHHGQEEDRDEGHEQ